MKLGTYVMVTWLIGIVTGLGIMQYKNSLPMSLFSVAFGGALVLALGFLYITSSER